MFSVRNISPTAQGFLALGVWATCATSIQFIKDLPQFEVLFISFFLAAVLGFATLKLLKIWQSIRGIPPVTWLIVGVGIIAFQFSYVFAFSYAPAAEADVIIYLWPAVAVVLSSIFLKFKLKFRYIITVILGIVAVLTLSGGFSSAGFDSFGIGHLFAFGSAVSCASYSVFIRNAKGFKPEMLIVAYAIGSVLALGFHVSTESFVIPSAQQSVAFIYYSYVVLFAAYFMWSNGLVKGDATLITLMSYCKPVISVLLLSAFGYASLTASVGQAIVLVTVSGMIANDSLMSFCASYLEQAKSMTLKASLKIKDAVPFL